MGRGTWYYDGHPPTCTCVECNSKRTRDSLSSWAVRFLFGNLLAVPVRYITAVLRALRII